jgi:hypothetical protein
MCGYRHVNSGIGSYTYTMFFFGFDLEYAVCGSTCKSAKYNMISF